MDILNEARNTINQIDAQMAALFSARMEAVAHIAACKAAQGLPILDEQREQQVVERNAALVDEEIRPFYVQFLEGTMAASRAYQQQLIEDAHDE